MLRPARSAKGAPARSLPVSETPWTRGLDHGGDVAGLEEEVREHAGRDPGVAEHLLEGERRLRTAARVLEQDRVAEHQVRGRDPGHLVERVVPRLHGEQRPERFGEQHGVACIALERPRRREPGAVATVVVEDLRGQVGLLTRLDDPLAHLQRDERREPVALLGQQFPRAMDDRGTLLDGPVTPGAEGLVRGLDGAVNGSRVEAVELPHDLPGVGIHCRVVMGRRCRHGRTSSPVRASRKWGVDSPRGRRVGKVHAYQVEATY
jgi:hypothetical protein